MPVDPNAGPAYQSPYDNVPEQPLPEDPGFTKEPLPPGEEEAGPMYMSPEAQRWFDQNVRANGFMVDWGNREVYDPKSGESKGMVPTSFDRMT